MTGTALAVADQLVEMYGLEVAAVPPNLPCVRVDEPERLYASVEARDAAVVAEVLAQHATGRPVLIGTLDVAESELLAVHLGEEGVECVVLNARNDAEEAAIIAEAGTYGAVTVSTQMAGRGVDIRLGGAAGADRERVVELGGLLVVATGHYPTSRLDDQLRGRAGRQGDPGTSMIFASLEDQVVGRYVPDADLAYATDDQGLDRGPGRARVGRARAADRRGRAARDPPQHLALRAPRRAPARAPSSSGATTSCGDDAAADLLVERSADAWDVAEERLGEEGVADLARQVYLHRARPRRGSTTSPTSPTCARASTCARSDGSARSTSTTARRSRRSRGSSTRSTRRAAAAFDELSRPRTARYAARARAAPDRDLDVRGPGEPVRHRVRACALGDARAPRPLARPRVGSAGAGPGVRHGHAGGHGRGLRRRRRARRVERGRPAPPRRAARARDRARAGRGAASHVADLDAIAVGVGPGPFTSLRVGVVTARTLGAVLGIPVHGVCTLDAIALDAMRLDPAPATTPFLVATDARRREVYWARYEDGHARRRPGVAKAG